MAKKNVDEKKKKKYTVSKVVTEPIKSRGKNMTSMIVTPNKTIDADKVLKYAQKILKKTMENDKTGRLMYAISVKDTKGMWRRSRAFKPTNGKIDKKTHDIV